MRRVLCLLLISVFFAHHAVSLAGAADPIGLIYDTDIGNDVDDVLALGVIHALQSRNQCRLLAVTVTKNNPLASELVSAINTFYGRGDVPIGMVRDGVTKEEGSFLKLARVRDNGHLRYPRKLDGDQTPEATEVLRRVLARQPDGSVAIVQVGFSTNLARLLESPPDAISPLAGRELVARKVRLLSIMAGDFRQPPPAERFIEYNVQMDVPSARRVAADWPTEVVFSGFEIGIAIPYPAVSIERDYGYVEHHPLAEAYYLYNPPPHERPTWDLTSVLYAAFPDRGYFDLSPPGTVIVEEDGFTRFEPSSDGRHRYLKVDALQIARVTEALVQLSSQPAGRAEGTEETEGTEGTEGQED